MRKTVCLILGVLTVVMMALSAPAANRYWDTSTATNFQSGNGIWSTNAADINWNSRATGLGSLSAFVDNDTALFGDNDGESGCKNIFSAGKISFHRTIFG